MALILSNELRDHDFGGFMIKKHVVTIDAATAWLTERADLRERREDRIEMVEWAVLIFVVLGVIVDIALLFRH